MNDTEKLYNFITFLDNGIVRISQFNETTKPLLYDKLKTENKPHLFEALDYHHAREYAIKYFNKDSDTQSE